PDFRAIVRVFGAGSRPAATAVVRGDPTPDGRVAGATDHRGVSVGISSRLLGAGQRPCVRPLTSRVRAMGIRDRPISPRSPWQNPYVERLIGTVRRECVDRVLVFGEAHLRQILSSYAAYYNEVRTHLALGKDAPLGRAAQRTGVIVAIPILSGLHHHYVRI